MKFYIVNIFEGESYERPSLVKSELIMTNYDLDKFKCNYRNLSEFLHSSGLSDCLDCPNYANLKEIFNKYISYGAYDKEQNTIIDASTNEEWALLCYEKDLTPRYYVKRCYAELLISWKEVEKPILL